MSGKELLFIVPQAKPMLERLQLIQDLLIFVSPCSGPPAVSAVIFCFPQQIPFRADGSRPELGQPLTSYNI